MGFFVILAVFVVTGVTAGILFDRTITNYLYLYEFITPPTVQYTYLDSKYYDDIMLPPPLAYERHVHGLNDFTAWKDMLLDANLHISNNPHPESVMIEQTSDFEKFFLDEIIVYHAAPPITNNNSEANGKAVLVIPGSGDGAAREIMGIQTVHTPYHDKIGLRLAMAGYDVYTLELDGWGERQKDAGSTCPNIAIPFNCEFFAFQEKLARYGISLNSIHDREVATTLSYIASKHDWVAVSGLSAGTSKALESALANPDMVNAVILASGITMIHEWPIFVTAGPYIETNYDVEGVDRVRALAPMPLYISYGSLEIGPFGYAAQSVDIQSMVQSTYEMHGAANEFLYVIHDGMHEYDIDSVITFLDSH